MGGVVERAGVMRAFCPPLVAFAIHCAAGEKEAHEGGSDTSQPEALPPPAGQGHAQLGEGRGKRLGRASSNPVANPTCREAHSSKLEICQ